jgi:hypothetical protein
MEPIAVNRLTVDQALLAEGHAAIFSQKRRKTLLYCGIVFLAFGLIFLALQARVPVLSALCVPTLLTGILVILWALKLQKSELRRKYKAFRRVNGDASQRTVTCHRTSLSVDAGHAEPTEIDYTDVREHKETEHLYLLNCSDHRGVMLARDGFETGSWDALLTAIDKAKQEAADAARLLEM